MQLSTHGKFVLGGTIGGILAFVILVIAIMCTISISPGQVGVLYDRAKGGVQKDPLLQGFHVIMPIKQSVQEYPVSTQTLELTASKTEGSPEDESWLIPTKENLNVNIDSYLSYHIEPAMAPHVYNKFRGRDIQDIAQTYIRTNMKNIAQNCTGTYSVLGIAGDQREEACNLITNNLKEFFGPDGIVVERFNFGEVRLPSSIQASVNDKINSAQQAQQAELILKKKEIEIKQAVAEAQGRAQAMTIDAKAQADANRIIAESLTPSLVQLKAIEKFNDKVNVMMVPPGMSVLSGMPGLFK